MTGNKYLFSSLEEPVQIDVTLGNNNKVTVLGKGMVNILTKKGEPKFMPDVYYVVGLKQNLMNIGQLIQKGYRVYMENNECVILDKLPSNMLIAKVQMTTNCMFPLKIRPAMKGKTAQAIHETHTVNSGEAFKVADTKSAIAKTSTEKFKTATKMFKTATKRFKTATEMFKIATEISRIPTEMSKTATEMARIAPKRKMIFCRFLRICSFRRSSYSLQL
ncbi:hypothetical protein KI387_002912, partial [Taxus chinensis]